MLSPTGALSPQLQFTKTGTMIMSPTSQNTAKLPFSFMTAVEKIEEDIEALRADLQFCRKEVVVLSTE